ncbi:phage tail assembly chaperone [Salibacterium aidingense]|uniref:phage tail assembly chaperone n=1 Tax=Salibacterium aidingense TaxID=384933 RepID=UPI003BE13B24
MANKSAVEALISSEVVEEKDLYIPRLQTYFTVKTIEYDEIKEVEDQSKEMVGKGSKRREEINEEKYGSLMIVKGCVEPQFADKRLLDHYGVSSADEVVTKSLRIGEIKMISAEILKISGFDDSEEEAQEKVEEAKN